LPQPTIIVIGTPAALGAQKAIEHVTKLPVDVR
jgi:hypothetical protein